MGIPTFWLEPSDKAVLGLRRYQGYRPDQVYNCGGKATYHNAIAFIGETRAKLVGKGDERHVTYPDAPKLTQSLKTAASWPVKCEGCGYGFKPTDEYQVWTELLYKRHDTGQTMTLRDAGPGAMWNAWWLSDWWKGQDGLAIMVKLPTGHDWCIDSQASNCDAPCKVCRVPYHAHKQVAGHRWEDGLGKHKCWIRHGKPPVLHVDKQGHTCGAGAGSIQVPGYHGFLHHGQLVQC